MKWWIKADGCDLVKGLFESTKGEWSGDVDLNSGQVQKLYRDLVSRLDFIQKMGLGSSVEMKRDLEAIVTNTTEDLKFCLQSKYMCMLHSIIGIVGMYCCMGLKWVKIDRCIDTSPRQVVTAERTSHS